MHMTKHPHLFHHLNTNININSHFNKMVFLKLEFIGFTLTSNKSSLHLYFSQITSDQRSLVPARSFQPSFKIQALFIISRRQSPKQPNSIGLETSSQMNLRFILWIFSTKDLGMIEHWSQPPSKWEYLLKHFAKVTLPAKDKWLAFHDMSLKPNLFNNILILLFLRSSTCQRNSEILSKRNEFL